MGITGIVRLSGTGSDGKTMCCLCFDRFEFEDLADITDGPGAGKKVDVCKPCDLMDKARVFGVLAKAMTYRET